MGIIERFMQNRRERKSKMEEFETNDRILSDIERKKLSHNEREMIAVMKRDKEKHLADALKSEEQRRKFDEIWHERNMMKSDIHLLE